MAQGRIGDAELRCSSGKACIFGDSDKRSQFGELGCAHVFLRTSDVSERGVKAGCPVRERRHRLGLEPTSHTPLSCASINLSARGQAIVVLLPPEPTMVSKRRLLELLHLLMNRFGASDS